MNRSSNKLAHVIFLSFLTFAFIFVSAPARAAPITIPLDGLAQIPAGSPQQPGETIDAFRARRLLEQVGELGLHVDAGLIFAHFPIEATTQELATRCPVPLPKSIHTNAAEVAVNLGSDSTVTFNLDSLRDLSVRFDVIGELHATTNAAVQWGQAIPFVGNCEKVGTDNGTLTVHLPFALQFSVNIRLDPQFDEQQLVFIIDKFAIADGSLELGSGWIDPDFGSVSLTDSVINAFEDNLLGRLRARGLDRFTSNLSRLNNRFAGLNEAGNPDPALEPFNGLTTFPLLTDATNQETAAALARELNLGNLIIQFFDTRGPDVLLQLLVLNGEQRSQFLAELGSTILCDAVLARYESTVAPQTPIYTIDANNNCVAAEPFGVDQGRYFLDQGCATEVAFRPTPAAEFCAATFGKTAKEILGNAAAWAPDREQVNNVLPQVDSRDWTALRSTRLNIGVLSNDAVSVPFTKQFNYKQVSTIATEPACSLEMRVSKKDIAATGLRPLLAIHGGTWESRGLSWIGLEATVAHFTERGFVVFAPFHRLVGSDDANAACNGAGWRDVVADVGDALQWVVSNGPALGVAPQPVTVFGQSSGAHLAAWLEVTRAADVQQALLYYPPSDMLTFVRDAFDGGPLTPFRSFGLNALARFFGARLGSSEINFDRINLAAATAATPPEQWRERVADDAIDWSRVDWSRPSIYLSRCAQAVQVDTAAIDPANVPRPLIDCAKQELGEFIAANAFHQRLSPLSPPAFVIHGVADSLVPWQQTAGLCDALAAAPIGAAPNGAADTPVVCGRSQIHLIEGAQHALDLGLCAGSLCPAGQPGSPTRQAVHDTLVAGLDWISTPPSITPPSTSSPSTLGENTRGTRSSSGGGGAVTQDAWMLILLVAATRRRQPWRYRMRSA